MDDQSIMSVVAQDQTVTEIMYAGRIEGIMSNVSFNTDLVVLLVHTQRVGE